MDIFEHILSSRNNMNAVLKQRKRLDYLDISKAFLIIMRSDTLILGNCNMLTVLDFSKDPYYNNLGKRILTGELILIG